MWYLGSYAQAVMAAPLVNSRGCSFRHYLEYSDFEGTK
ncbi:hypothetical protein OROHE_009570 [Orobanche hederae]